MLRAPPNLKMNAHATAALQRPYPWLTDWLTAAVAGEGDANRVQNVCTSAYKFLLFLLAPSQAAAAYTLLFKFFFFLVAIANICICILFRVFSNTIVAATSTTAAVPAALQL